MPSRYKRGHYSLCFWGAWRCLLQDNELVFHAFFIKNARAGTTDFNNLIIMDNISEYCHNMMTESPLSICRTVFNEKAVEELLGLSEFTVKQIYEHTETFAGLKPGEKIVEVRVCDATILCEFDNHCVCRSAYRFAD